MVMRLVQMLSRRLERPRDQRVASAAAVLVPILVFTVCVQARQSGSP